MISSECLRSIMHVESYNIVEDQLFTKNRERFLLTEHSVAVSYFDLGWFYSQLRTIYLQSSRIECLLIGAT